MRGTWMALLLLVSAGTAPGQTRFRPDDPLWKDEDQLPVTPPQRVRLSQIYDFLENSFRNRPHKGSPIPPASNINTLGEIPDSSWFTNRMGRRIMSIEELVRGPNQSSGPDQSSRWAIIAVKTEGVTPGFTIRDGRGEIYFIKFDPPGYLGMASAAGVISGSSVAT